MLYGALCLVNGEIIAAESAESLHDRILEKIKEIEAMYDFLVNKHEDPNRSGVSISKARRF